MRRRPLGATGLTVSELGFGCAGFWARAAFPEAQAIELVHAAIEGGVTLFDTGPTYGGGLAEQRLGKALRSHGSADIVVSTKAGSFLGGRSRPYRDFTPSAIAASAESSLRRLGRDHVELLLLHGPDASHITDDVLACMDRLRDRGLIGTFGVNGFSPGLVRVVAATELLTTMMFDYSIVERRQTEHIAYLAAAGKAFLASTPLAQGHLDPGLWRLRSPADVWYLARALGRRRDLIRRGRSYRFVAGYPGWSGAQIALAYALRNPNVTSVVFGTTRLSHLLENLATSGRALESHMIQAIEDVPSD